MPDISFSTEDAIERLTSARDSAVSDIEGEYNRLATQLRQVKVAREQLNNNLLEMGAAAIGVINLVVHDHGNGRKLTDFFLTDGYQTAHSEQCRLLRPLKPGRYRVVVVFTEDAPPADPSGNPKR